MATGKWAYCFYLNPQVFSVLFSHCVVEEGPQRVSGCMSSCEAGLTKHKKKAQIMMLWQATLDRRLSFTSFFLLDVPTGKPGISKDLEEIPEDYSVLARVCQRLQLLLHSMKSKGTVLQLQFSTYCPLETSTFWKIQNYRFCIFLSLALD